MTEDSRKEESTRAPTLAVLLLAAALAGCGGSVRDEETPALPADLAETLAARAEAVAERLAAGDPCAARAEADELVRETTEAVQARRVPVELETELVTGAQDLAARIACPPEAAPPGDEPEAQEPPADPAPAPGVQTLALGDAGEIDFRLGADGETLELLEVRPAPGWRHSVSADEDELDVDLGRGSREVSVAIDADGGGRLTFDVDYEAGRGSGTHVIRFGDAGEVAVEVEGQTLRLLHAQLAAGWDVSVDEDEDSVDVEARHADGSELSLVVDVGD